MKKKIVAIMMMAVLALSTAACGADGGNNGGGTQAIQGEALLPQLSQTRINLWYGLTVSRQTVLQESLT